jgi:Fe-S-cluster containining protein
MLEADKAELFPVYDQAYALTADAELPCWTVCRGLCEEKENAYFLPLEEEYIAGRLGLGPDAFPPVKAHEGPVNAMVSITTQGLVPRHCPFDEMKDGFHNCTIHGVRPMDCRSFPVFPIYHPDKPEEEMAFYAADYCPVHQNLPQAFLERIVSAWRLLAPRLPDWWWREYNQDLPASMTPLDLKFLSPPQKP